MMDTKRKRTNLNHSAPSQAASPASLGSSTSITPHNLLSQGQQCFCAPPRPLTSITLSSLALLPQGPELQVLRTQPGSAKPYKPRSTCPNNLLPARCTLAISHASRAGFPTCHTASILHHIILTFAARQITGCNQQRARDSTSPPP